MARSLHSRMMIALGRTVMHDADTPKREVLLEAHDRATGRVRSEIDKTDLAERLSMPDPTDDELRAAITTVLAEYEGQATDRAKAAREVLEPLLA